MSPQVRLRDSVFRVFGLKVKDVGFGLVELMDDLFAAHVMDIPLLLESTSRRPASPMVFHKDLMSKRPETSELCIMMFGVWTLPPCSNGL